jgi:tetratricopeptide (TPR) repeat protein
VLGAGLAARLDRWFIGWPGNRAASLNPLTVLIGGGQKLFAGSFYREADVYYHSGYYPSIYDNREAFETAHMAADTGAVASHNKGDEEGFLGPPLDVIDSFSRHFVPDKHTHLDEGGAKEELGKSDKVREILPWLKISSLLDPENVNTYIVTAFWLRSKLNKVAEAEQVLREGLRNNPNDPHLLFELGRIYFENYHDTAHARNIWVAGLRTWERQAPGVPLSERLKPTKENIDSLFIFEQLQTRLAQLEEKAGNLDAAIARWEQVKLASVNPGDVQRHIDELKRKLAAPASATNNPAQ